MDLNKRQLIAMVYGIPFIWIGIQHFFDPEWFEPIVPSILGNPTFWIYLSGAWEISLGTAILIPALRKYASLGIVMMLVALYWANLNMWINDISIEGTNLSFFGHLVRGIIQIILIIIALYIGKWPPFVSVKNDMER